MNRAAISTALSFTATGSTLTTAQQVTDPNGDAITNGMFINRLTAKVTTSDSATEVALAVFSSQAEATAKLGPEIYTTDSAGDFLLIELDAAGMYYPNPGIYFPAGAWIALVVDGGVDVFDVTAQYTQL